MAIEETRKVLGFNIKMKCDYKCEECEKFFDCKDEQKFAVYRRRRMSQAIHKMSGINHKISVSGGKGGVGKSLVTVNLATALALKGRKVSILDQDFDGSTIPKMLGIQGLKKLKYGTRGIIPASDNLGLGIGVVSMGLIYPDEVVTLFHGLRRATTEEFIAGVDYGKLDYLLVDLPPGTSSDACNLLQYIPDLDGTIIVTAPSAVSQMAARKATILSAKAGSRILGIIENMSGYICECGMESTYLGIGGGKKLAEELAVPFLGRIPLHSAISQCSDEGVPFVYKFPDIPSSREIMKIADKLETIINFKK